MKSILKTLAIVITFAFTVVSCSSDKDNDGDSVSASRDIKYEVTGDFAGELSVIYMEKSTAPLNEDIEKLPWIKELTANPDATGASMNVSGYGGVKGQTLTGKIYIGGKVVKELTATADNDGIIILMPGTYIFPR